MPGKKDAAWWRDYRARKETAVEQPVDKAIKTDKAKPEGRGRLSKGLGEVPGVTKGVDSSMSDAWSRSQPAPKPGKK